MLWLVCTQRRDLKNDSQRASISIIGRKKKIDWKSKRKLLYLTSGGLYGTDIRSARLGQPVYVYDEVERVFYTTDEAITTVTFGT